MTPRRGPRCWPAERLAYWYFRLNGFFTIENFIVHSDTGPNQRTDADVLAVRFAYRAENLQRPMLDDPKVSSCPTLVNAIIAEVKTGPCQLNGPWTNRAEMNMQRVVKAMGFLPDGAIDSACDALHKQGHWSDATVTIRLLAIGETRTTTLPMPAAQQLTWDEVIEFCVTRFKDYRREKSSLGQWKEDGRRLRIDALSRQPASKIRASFGLTRFAGSNPDA